ncbi:MAG: hypothetical protein L0216_19125 [Planctomycetales bacterium]|nr:hypothetical protein [Planctomycetales bacterium]
MTAIRLLVIASLAGTLVPARAQDAADPSSLEAAARRTLAALLGEARANAARKGPERLAGDALADAYLRRAAGALAERLAAGPAAAEEARELRGFLVGLGTFMDPNGALARDPRAALALGPVESEAERAERVRVRGTPSIRGREDWTAHFWISAALRGLAGAGFAESVGIRKEVEDAGVPGKGFSLGDLCADLAGIEFAGRLLEGGAPLASARALAASGRHADWMPEARDLPEGLDAAAVAARFGGERDERMRREVANLRERIRGAPGHARAAAPPKEEPGLAARYPGDRGIGRDPAVLLHEDFEPPGFRSRWDDLGAHPETLSVVERSDAPEEVAHGERSLRITATLGRDTGGHLFKRFVPGRDALFARFYVRFDPGCDHVHHFVHLVAEATEARWPSGGAGERPAGDQKFSTGLEPWSGWGKLPAPGAWHFYSYWHEMKRAPDGKFWGNFFDPDPPVPIEAGRWTCCEMSLRANDPPEAANGEQAFWVDGKLAGRFGGIRWRTDARLKVNAFWLLFYVTDHSAKRSRVNRVAFDDVVVAERYIGPRAEAGRSPVREGR